MSTVQISTLNPALDDDIFQQGLMQNSDATRSGFAKITNQVLGNTGVTSNQALSSTQSPVPGLATSTNSSGGLHHVYANVLYQAAGGSALFQLCMDGAPIAQGSAGSGGASNTFNHTVPLHYFGNVPPGQHTFQVLAQTSNGSGHTVVPGSQIYVVEHLT